MLRYHYNLRRTKIRLKFLDKYICYSLTNVVWVIKSEAMPIYIRIIRKTFEL